MLAVLSHRLFGYVLLYVGHCAVATVAVCGFGSWGMPHQISPLPHGPTPSQTEVSSTMGESIRPSSFHNPTLSANKHFVHICRSSLLAAADGLTDGSGDRRTSPFNGIERLLSRAVVPKTKSLRVSATTFPAACLCTSQGRLRKDIRYPSRTVAIRKGNTVKLGYYVPSMEKKKRYVVTKVRSIQNVIFLNGRTGSTCSHERSATEDASSSWMWFIIRFSYGEIAFQGIVKLKTCPGNWNWNWKVGWHARDQKKKNQRKGKKSALGGKIGT